MCGIVGFTGGESAVPVLLQGLYKLEYRGYDSAGVAAYSGETLTVIKTKGRIAQLEEKIEQTGGIDAHCGIGHTRWATHGEPSDVNSHPHLSGSGRIAVVHNGIIENYLDLRQSLENKGYVFRSQTDTETVAHLIDYLYIDQKRTLAAAVLEAVTKIRGSYALGVLCADRPEEIIAARRGSPLIIGLGEGRTSSPRTFRPSSPGPNATSCWMTMRWPWCAGTASPSTTPWARRSRNRCRR